MFLLPTLPTFDFIVIELSDVGISLELLLREWVTFGVICVVRTGNVIRDNALGGLLRRTQTTREHVTRPRVVAFVGFAILGGGRVLCQFVECFVQVPGPFEAILRAEKGALKRERSVSLK